VSCGFPATSQRAETSGRRWLQVSAGSSHTCALATDGRAYCWGANTDGQLGTGALGDTALAPASVAGGLRFIQIGTGAYHSCGITVGAEGYCWGDNRYGQLGSGTAVRHSPVPILIAGGLRLTQINGGFRHGCAITTAGEAYCWGDNSAAQLGAARTGEICSLGDQPYHQIPCSRFPLRVSADSQRFATVSAGDFHTCALDESGGAHCWGHATFGQLGRPGSDVCAGYDTSVDCSIRPGEVVGGVAWVTLVAGLATTCGLTADGRVYCWGDRRFGLFVGDSTSAGPPYAPRPVGGRLTYRALAVTRSPAYACGITAGGALYCWGALPWHFRRDPLSVEVVFTPGPERVPTEARFVAIMAGTQHVCGLSAAGDLFCFGANHYGQLGSGSRTHHRTPVRVPLPAHARSQPSKGR
jgi:alpha-tubulin suppressor-like RCC1 family protein